MKDRKQLQTFLKTWNHARRIDGISSKFLLMQFRWSFLFVDVQQYVNLIELVKRFHLLFICVTPVSMHFVAKFRFDTAENESAKKLQKIAN